MYSSTLYRKVDGLSLCMRLDMRLSWRNQREPSLAMKQGAQIAYRATQLFRTWEVFLYSYRSDCYRKGYLFPCILKWCHRCISELLGTSLYMNSACNYTIAVASVLAFNGQLWLIFTHFHWLRNEVVRSLATAGDSFIISPNLSFPASRE